jgi:hypothetical protein
MESLLAGIIKQNVNDETWLWLEQRAGQLDANCNAGQLNATFAAVPRKTGKKVIDISKEQEQAINLKREGFLIRGWTIDRLTRVWLLLKLNSNDKDNYIRVIENIFLAAEMNELVALYSALPLLAYPEAWQFRCTEGIRSNIGNVLEAIMYENPYPAEQLDEPAWNQLVLKAFFTDKHVERIIGLDKRANKQLATILIDYVHERRSAHRKINLQLWRLIGKFVDEKNFQEISNLYHNGDDIEKKAALLACGDSNYAEAKELLNQTPDLKHAIEEKSLTWEELVKEIRSASLIK